MEKRKNPQYPTPSPQSRTTVFLAAGGTGGHIFPAAALAEVLLKRGVDVRLVTDARFHSYNHSARDNVLTQIPVHTIHAGNFSGNPIRKLLGMVAILRGVLEARRLIRTHRPACVVGFGGYPSLPTMLAAVLTGRRTIIHEQNSVLGRVNRLIAARVSVIATTYKETRKMPTTLKQVVYCGNPVRASVASLVHIPYTPLETGGLMRLMVIGGSQGATVFSDVLPAALGLLSPDLRARIRLDQQCRPQELDAVRERYQALDMQVDLAPFFTDVAARLGAAHLVISRAGASSVAELAVAGRPAILVPLPTAMDNHQYFNAQAVEAAGAGWVIPQEGFTPQTLATKLETLLRAPGRLSECAAAMRALGQVDAAETLANVVTSCDTRLG